MVYNEDETANMLANILAEKLEKEFGTKYIVKCKYNICYMAKILGYNEKGIPVFEEADGKKYKYQTDICIFKKQNDLLIPIIIIETKLRTYTTHDVITYCNKASDHKRFHNNLKYGFVVMNPEEECFKSRFFAHNDSFDFAAMVNVTNKSNNGISTNDFFNEYIKKIIDAYEKSGGEVKGFINYCKNF
ncbi:MAG: hypothetical protein IJZ59_04055 [Alphaproteobacteria bacterium]|nr:hypothetical protein [Alphaproteobacteria bacterium]